MLITTDYQIKFDPNLQGWIAFRVIKEGHRPFKLIEKIPLTNPKAKAYLAAQALTRVLRLNK